MWMSTHSVYISGVPFPPLTSLGLCTYVVLYELDINVRARVCPSHHQVNFASGVYAGVSRVCACARASSSCVCVCICICPMLHTSTHRNLIPNHQASLSPSSSAEFQHPPQKRLEGISTVFCFFRVVLVGRACSSVPFEHQPEIAVTTAIL